MQNVIHNHLTFNLFFSYFRSCFSTSSSFLPSHRYRSVIKSDPISGFCEFPSPGDAERRLLNHLIDPELILLESAGTMNAIVGNDREVRQCSDIREYWMPDQLCKACYTCEDAFTVYRRRHHCRVCGQVFCDRCSSYYIDGLWINLQGPVRACKFCSEQLAIRIEKESSNCHKSNGITQNHFFPEDLRRLSTQNSNIDYHGDLGTIRENPLSKMYHTTMLQKRASEHLEKLVVRMLNESDSNIDSQRWRDIILRLAIKVVSTVEPNVRLGDSMDIREYVKMKIIPGGSMEESVYVNGIVFRKRIYHKSILSRGPILNPRVLLLGGGIEFQRSDWKFSSLETLIEQEEKYLEILVEKISSLRPDVLIVGKSISGKARELLRHQNIVALQNFKESQLERISRLLDAIVLPTTDHVIQQNGDDCIGSSQKFSVKIINNDSERVEKNVQIEGILKDRICKGSCYIYLDGCPPKQGCSIILRGECRGVLHQIKRILKFSIIVAYHLRLEVAYYNDRYAMIPISSVGEDKDMYNEEWIKTNVISNLTWEPNLDALNSIQDRKLLSTSLSVDICSPCINPIRGILVAYAKEHPLRSPLAIDYHRISYASIITEENTQKNKSELACVDFYGKTDTTLGRFLIDRCFRQKFKEKENFVRSNLTFVHRTGRLDFDISFKEGEDSNAATIEGDHLFFDPLKLPIYTSSYCKVCENWVTPYECLSEESWKMSMGKFLEITFYNNSAICRTGNCTHSIRDCHVLTFFCHTHEGRFQARVNFKRLFSFSLRIRKFLPLDTVFHREETIKFLRSFSKESSTTLHDFKKVLSVIEKDVHDTLHGDERFELVVQDIKLIHQEIDNFKINIESSLQCCLDFLSRSISEACEDSHVHYEEDCSSNIGEELRIDRNDPIEVRYPMIFSSVFLTKAQEWNRVIDMWHHYLVSRNAVEISGSMSASQDLEECASRISGDNFDSNTKFLDQKSSGSCDGNIISENHNPSLIHEAISSDTNEGKWSSKSFNLKRNLVRQNNKYDNMCDRENSERIHVANKYSYELTDDKCREESIESFLPGNNDVHSPVKESFYFSSGRPTDDSRSKSGEKERLRGMFGGKKLSQAFARFKLGSNHKQEERAAKFNVPLDNLTRGRFSLKPGKEGKVLLVNEDDIASIISYSLASEEYSRKFFDEIDEHCTDQVEVNFPRRKVDHERCNSVRDDNVDKNFMEAEHHLRDARVQEECSSYSASNILGVASVLEHSAEFTKLSIVEERQVPHRAKELQYVKQMRSLKKHHVKHRFEDRDECDIVSCKFICHTFWAAQFRAVREIFLQDETDEGFIRSLALSSSWNAQGGKSGAVFSKTFDGRFVVKCISRTELQMFLEIAPEYFNYLADTHLHNKCTVLCKIYGIYQVGYHNKVTGKKVMEQVVVMENVFHERNITRLFDLKGSSRGRYATTEDKEDFDTSVLRRCEAKKAEAPYTKASTFSGRVLMDDNFMELTNGLPFPMKYLANEYLQRAIENDTEFLSSVNIVDYSILVGIDEDNLEVSVGIIDYMRQYDIIKRVERMGKSVGMIAGQAEPTIVQPSQYKNRFRLAMERNFMGVPDKYDF